jgi:hypothetical protein
MGSRICTKQIAGAIHIPCMTGSGTQCGGSLSLDAKAMKLPRCDTQDLLGARW